MATAIKHSRVQSKERKRVSSPHVGTEVRELRSRHGLSQGLLSRLLDVSLRSVSGLESGSVVAGTASAKPDAGDSPLWCVGRSNGIQLRRPLVG